MALNWRRHQYTTGFWFDSTSTLVSTCHMFSDSRQDIVFDIIHLIYRIKHRGIEIHSYGFLQISV